MDIVFRDAGDVQRHAAAVRILEQQGVPFFQAQQLCELRGDDAAFLRDGERLTRILIPQADKAVQLLRRTGQFDDHAASGQIHDLAAVDIHDFLDTGSFGLSRVYLDQQKLAVQAVFPVQQEYILYHFQLFQKLK